MTPDVGSRNLGNRKSLLTKLKDDWIAFLGIVLNPINLGLMILTGGLMALHLATPAETKPSPVVDAAITIMIAVLSGLVGARISDEWTKVTEAGVLVTRGKSAIRGLKLLLNNISATEKRVTDFVGDIDLSHTSSIPTMQGYEELLDKCNALEEATINAIEEWQDIIPEAANLSTQIGLISQLKGEGLSLHRQIVQAKAELDTLNTVREKSDEEKEQLSLSLKENEEELKKVNAELRAARSKLDATVLGGSPLSIKPTAFTADLNLNNIQIGTIISNTGSFRRCYNCGYFVEAADTTKKCPKCGSDI